ncbi:hypothetical protein BKA57DRAFT_176296 [Linnemannia elongata]|nr:hypothetical protein BKA57DRAFT_176296 [Linnemannia elongata]
MTTGYVSTTALSVSHFFSSLSISHMTISFVLESMQKKKVAGDQGPIPFGVRLSSVSSVFFLLSSPSISLFSLLSSSSLLLPSFLASFFQHLFFSHTHTQYSILNTQYSNNKQYLSLFFIPDHQTAMSHQRSQSTSSILNEHSNNAFSPSSYTNNNTTKTAPLSISLPRQRSMSTSFGLPGCPPPSSSSAAPTSPVATFSASSSINPNPFLNPIISPSSAQSSGGGGSVGSNATPSSTLASLSSSIPSSLNRRFSANFTNPLTTPAHMATSPTSIVCISFACLSICLEDRHLNLWKVFFVSCPTQKRG